MDSDKELWTSKGTCYICKGTFSKAGMTRHIASCRRKQAKTPSRKSKGKPTKIFHLVVEGRYLPDFWLHLDVPARSSLKNLDSYLRDIWLECCGHMSAFTIEGTGYSVYPMPGFNERDMSTSLGKVLRPRMKFSYEYDFGSTTELLLKVASEREGVLRGIKLLARNDLPPIICESCGEPATVVCTQCIWYRKGAWLCDRCARDHACGEDMFLPVVNSPRVGVCAYTGSTDQL
jgi:hypothetical protein